MQYDMTDCVLVLYIGAILAGLLTYLFTKDAIEAKGTALAMENNAYKREYELKGHMYAHASIACGAFTLALIVLGTVFLCV